MLINIQILQPLSLQKSQTNGTDLTSLISWDMFFSAVNVTAIWPDHLFGEPQPYK